MECQKCAKCCIEKTVPISELEIERISKISDLPFFRTRISGSRVLNWYQHKNHYYCIFLNSDTLTCNVYKDRPKVCQEYYCYQKEG